jgi:hypothetical protein
MQQNFRGRNGAVSLKKQWIWWNQAGGSSQRMWRRGRWRRSWCCSHIFLVRGDGAAGAMEIVMVRNCEVLRSVRTVCTLLFFLLHLCFLGRTSARSCRMNTGRYWVQLSDKDSCTTISHHDTCHNSHTIMYNNQIWILFQQQEYMMANRTIQNGDGHSIFETELNRFLRNCWSVR